MDASIAISTLQEFLNELGYYNCSVTGVYDKATKDAVKRFQEHENIENTGFPDEDTVNILAFRCAIAGRI